MPLVLPTGCLYQFNIGDISCWNVAVDPQKAITMVENKGIKFLGKDGKINLLLIPDEKQAYRINNFAYRQQCYAGEGWVISPKKETLEYLQNHNDVIDHSHI